MTRGSIATPESAGVCTEEMRLLGRYRRAFAIGDALAHTQCGGFAFQREGSSLLTGHGPRKKQIQLAFALGDRHDIVRIGQAGKRIFCRETGDVIGGTHRLLNRRIRKIRGAGVTPAVAEIDRDAQGLVPIALHIFEFAIANGNAQATTFRHLGPGIAGTQFFGVGQRGIHAGFEKSAGVGETAISRFYGGCGGLGTGGGGFLHGDGYDTWLCHAN